VIRQEIWNSLTNVLKKVRVPRFSLGTLGVSQCEALLINGFEKVQVPEFFFWTSRYWLSPTPQLQTQQLLNGSDIYQKYLSSMFRLSVISTGGKERL
jgi:hypothetical protein